jgi:hypothetical protein
MKKGRAKWQQAPIPDILTQFEVPQAEDANYKAELKNSPNKYRCHPL